jgi:hypothetical protein
MVNSDEKKAPCPLKAKVLICFSYQSILFGDWHPSTTSFYTSEISVNNSARKSSS